MKKSITVSALLVLLSAGLFAATPAKALTNVVPMHADVTFTALPSNNGIAVKVLGSEAGKTSIVIYDSEGNALRKDVLNNAKSAGKGYILTSLDNGDYSIEVTTNGKVVKEAVHIYDEDQTKMFIIKG